MTNTLRFGVSGAAGGIFGIALGTFIVAGISTTSLGLILASSTVAFTVMKYIGAAYLFYLGIKLWRSEPLKMHTNAVVSKSRNIQLIEGLTLQLTNPKAVFFFLSVFPQFIDFTANYSNQFVLLVVTYSCLVVLIHFLYACLAKKARSWLTSEKGGRSLNRVGGGTFMCFGLGLASASK